MDIMRAAEYRWRVASSEISLLMFLPELKARKLAYKEYAGNDVIITNSAETMKGLYA